MDAKWEVLSVAMDIARLRGELYAIAAEAKFRRLARELKANFNPGQARDDLGRWVDEGGGSSAQVGRLRSSFAAMRRRAECEFQYKKDIFQCKMVGLASCYAQAMVRKIACERGRLFRLSTTKGAGMIIASRELVLRLPDGNRNVAVRLFVPERDGAAWLCQYEIQWPEEVWSSFAAGLDSMQALVLALQKIGSDIYFSDYHKSGALMWDVNGAGYGFPLPPSARDVMVGDDRKYY